MQTMELSIRDDWPMWQRHGKVSTFAAKMGMTVPQLKAAIAATEFPNAVRWSRLSDETMRLVLEAWEGSSLGIGRFASKHGYSSASLASELADRFGSEYRAIGDKKAIDAGSRYRLGADFERRMRRTLEDAGFFVMRSPASKSAVDLLAVRAELVLFVQAKRGGLLPRDEWNGVIKAAWEHGGVPVMVENPHPGEVRWWELLGEREHGKSGQKRPLVETFRDFGLVP